MSVDVRVLDGDDADERWNRALGRSPHGTVFHRWEFLQTVARHTDGTLHPLAGFKGEQPVGLFPVFELRKGPVTAVASPPPELGVPHLGPALLPGGRKQRKRERLDQRFVEGCLDWIDDEVDPSLVHLVTSSDYGDVRPFQWNDFEATPKYTYELDISGGSDALLDRVSRDARTSVTGDADCEVVPADGADLDYVVDRVNDRYASDDGGLHLDHDYVRDVFDSLPDGQAHAKVARVDGERVSGRLQFRFDDTLRFWQGSPKPERDVDAPVNDLLNWAVISDAADDGLSRCDLTGANTRRVCRYKAKYNPTVETYYELQRGSAAMNVATDLYRKFR
ncbi:GNAT family N-acetyltransferase [Halospeciosus flavus]|uniref:GNAT family N-acetyltransferase n=1 Tax=Halospeciosus flavus TaxID=3032283 RepID=A0ABD5Z133_9EURY|nr:GNAT family N-acetyltransferase [Halospeciosus flavus]